MFALLLLCFQVIVSAQPYFEITSCNVVETTTTCNSSHSIDTNTEGRILVDLDYWSYEIEYSGQSIKGSLVEEYSIASTEYNGYTLYYWLLQGNRVISALIHDDTFSPKWVKYSNTENSVKLQLEFVSCDKM